jgi:hypothetical protein
MILPNCPKCKGDSVDSIGILEVPEHIELPEGTSDWMVSEPNLTDEVALSMIARAIQRAEMTL